MEPWLDYQTAGRMGRIIGSSIGILGALLGCSCGICVSKGWKKPIYAMFIFGIVICSVLLVTGIIALCIKQPYHVWYGFLLPGSIGTVIFSALLPVARNRFIAQEMKKMQAEDL